MQHIAKDAITAIFCSQSLVVSKFQANVAIDVNFKRCTDLASCLLAIDLQLDV